jgi:hypothetical protein
MSVIGGYRMQEIPREEIAACDPYGGSGLFLEAPGLEPAEILARLEERLGVTVPAVAWGGIGAWIDPGSSGTNVADLRDLWDGGKASEHG